MNWAPLPRVFTNPRTRYHYDPGEGWYAVRANVLHDVVLDHWILEHLGGLYSSLNLGYGDRTLFWFERRLDAIKFALMKT